MPERGIMIISYHSPDHRPFGAIFLGVRLGGIESRLRRRRRRSRTGSDFRCERATFLGRDSDHRIGDAPISAMRLPAGSTICSDHGNVIRVKNSEVLSTTQFLAVTLCVY